MIVGDRLSFSHIFKILCINGLHDVFFQLLLSLSSFLRHEEESIGHFLANLDRLLLKSVSRARFGILSHIFKLRVVIFFVDHHLIEAVAEKANSLNIPKNFNSPSVRPHFLQSQTNILHDLDIFGLAVVPNLSFVFLIYKLL